jgi:hypothetical protein
LHFTVGVQVAASNNGLVRGSSRDKDLTCSDRQGAARTDGQRREKPLELDFETEAHERAPRARVRRPCLCLAPLLSSLSTRLRLRHKNLANPERLACRNPYLKAGSSFDDLMQIGRARPQAQVPCRCHQRSNAQPAATQRVSVTSPHATLAQLVHLLPVVLVGRGILGLMYCR